MPTGVPASARVVAVLLVVAAALLGGAGPALADGGPAGADVHVAQSLGDRELTVVLRAVDAVPGPLRVEVVAHAGSAPGPLGVRLRADGVDAAAADLVLAAGPSTRGVTLPVGHAGPWELLLVDGDLVASVPFVVPAAVTAPWERAAYGGFVAAGVLLAAALGTALRARRTATALVPAGGAVVALTVAVTAALLSATIPAPPEPGTLTDPTRAGVQDPWAAPPPGDPSRPPAVLTATAPGGAVGVATDVLVELVDGATGRPVDDLLVHHDSFLHLVLVGPSGRLWHLHPVRTGPGRYTARFTPPDPGRHAVAAEFARRGGGTQLARTELDVPGAAGPAAPEPPPAATVTAVPAPAGAVSTLAVRVGEAADLQPWLGMTGHLLVAGPLPGDGPVGAAVADAPVWAHVHSTTGLPAGPAAARPDVTVAAFGPEVRFTYTFPRPGRYRLWFQTMRGSLVVTVPTVVDVPPAP